MRYAVGLRGIDWGAWDSAALPVFERVMEEGTKAVKEDIEDNEGFIRACLGGSYNERTADVAVSNLACVGNASGAPDVGWARNLL
jgi:hypothetical protein